MFVVPDWPITLSAQPLADKPWAAWSLESLVLFLQNYRHEQKWHRLRHPQKSKFKKFDTSTHAWVGRVEETAEVMELLLGHTDSTHVVGMFQCRGMGKSRALDMIPAQIHENLAKKQRETGLDDREKLLYDATDKVLKINFINGNGSPKRQELGLGVEVSLCLRLLHAGYVEQARKPGDVHHFTMVLKELLRYEGNFTISLPEVVGHFSAVKKPLIVCDEVQIYGRDREDGAEVLGRLCDTLAASAFVICAGTSIQGFLDSQEHDFLQAEADLVLLNPLSMAESRQMASKTLERWSLTESDVVHEAIRQCGGIPRMLTSFLAAVHDYFTHAMKTLRTSFKLPAADDSVATDAAKMSILQGVGSWDAAKAVHFSLGLKPSGGTWASLALGAACSRVDAYAGQLLSHVASNVVLLKSHWLEATYSAFVPLLIVVAAVKEEPFSKQPVGRMLSIMLDARSQLFPPLGSVREKPMAFLKFVAAHFGAVLASAPRSGISFDSLMAVDGVFQEYSSTGVNSIMASGISCLNILGDCEAPQLKDSDEGVIWLHGADCPSGDCSAVDWRVSLPLRGAGLLKTVHVVSMAFFETEAKVTCQMVDSVFGVNGTSTVGDCLLVLLIESVWPVSIEEDCFQEGRYIIVKDGQKFFDFLGPFFRQFGFEYNLNSASNEDLKKLLGSDETAEQVASARPLASLRSLQGGAAFGILQPLDEMGMLTF